MSYPPVSDEEIFRHCNRQCGVITTTEDQQFFALGCILCAEKFLYFDAFVGHMQTTHAAFGQKEIYAHMFDDSFPEIHNGDCNSTGMVEGNSSGGTDEDDLTDGALLEPPMVMIKEEIVDEDMPGDNVFTSEMPDHNDEMVDEGLFQVKEEQPDDDENVEIGERKYISEAYNSYDDYESGVNVAQPTVEEDSPIEDEDTNYDDLVEESLLGGAGLTMHIKDRKMIKFLIDSYRRNPFLWDHCHIQFRDRYKRQQFLDWIMMEFKRRFNITLAKDAVTRKWDNLRTVYKRECNRMSLEKTNVSTLWYFKELNFLHRFYGGNQKLSDAVVKDTVYRRRYSALWNDVSTTKLLQMVEYYPCFYDKYNIDYRSKEKRGEALQLMSAELQKMVDVTTIQISKRISQLRFDYSKQKQERLQCEHNNKVFIPTYTYYEQMLFMDADIAPFKCDHCPIVLQTPREMDAHLLTHQTGNTGGLTCTFCHLIFPDTDQLNRHKQVHEIADGSGKDISKKYHCDLCTASFREKTNYDEHMRRHNDELLLPTLTGRAGTSDCKPATETKPFTCEVCGKAFVQQGYLNAHYALHMEQPQRSFKCDYPHCGRTFTARQSMSEHMKLHYNDEEYRCDVCGKGFRSTKNLQNHKQIHDAVKKYICKICGSAFAQAAGLYLHKRRHNRPTERSRLNR